MKLQIDKLKRRPRQILVDEPAENFPVLLELIKQGALTFTEKISGALEATWAGAVVEVKGRLMTSVMSPCGRCLSPVPAELTIPVSLAFKQSEGGEEEFVEDLELQEDDLGLIPFVGTEIDLQVELVQEIIMLLPQQSLCSDQCQGLCPVCGVALSSTKCDCVPPVFHAGLAALQNFKVKK